MTRLASLPLLLCARMASTKLDVRPSWRKKMRCPTPQSGAVRNSSGPAAPCVMRSEEHTSELQSRGHLVCRLLLEKKKKKKKHNVIRRTNQPKNKQNTLHLLSTT